MPREYKNRCVALLGISRCPLGLGGLWVGSGPPPPAWGISTPAVPPLLDGMKREQGREYARNWHVIVIAIVLSLVCVCVLPTRAPLAIEFNESLQDGECGKRFEDEQDHCVTL